MLFSKKEQSSQVIKSENKVYDVKSEQFVAIRDDLDINGGNFVKPKKSIEINTSDKTISQVYDIMLGEIYKKMKNV